MATLSSILQAPIQALVRPSMWLPCVRSLHSCTEIWKTTCCKVDFRNDLVNAIYKIIDENDGREFWDFHKVNDDGSFFRIFTFTRAKWLDVIEVTYKDGNYEVCSFSSGILPLMIPFACIFNMVFFFVPFVDMGLNKRRLQRLKDALSIHVTTV